MARLVDAQLRADVRELVPTEDDVLAIEPIGGEWEIPPLAQQVPPVPSVVGSCLIVPEVLVRGWATDNVTDPVDLNAIVNEGALDEEADRAVARALHRAGRLGRASHRALSIRLKRAMVWVRVNWNPDFSSFETFSDAVARLVLRRMSMDLGPEALSLELADQTERDIARVDNAALARYLLRTKAEVEVAERRLRPSARSESIENFVGDVTTELLTLVRSGNPDAFNRYERPGRPAHHQLVNHLRVAARRKRRLHVAVYGTATNLLPVSVSPEDELLEREESSAGEIIARARSTMTERQREYLDGLLTECDLGPSRGLLARTARRLKRDKSQITRALRVLRAKLRPNAETARSRPADAQVKPRSVRTVANQYLGLKRASQSNRRFRLGRRRG
jgi:hypothetical protein